MKLRPWIVSPVKGPGGAAELIAIAAPLVVSYACETVMMFTDRLFMSRVSGAHMAATMGGGLTSFTFTTFFMGILGYATAMVAQNLGAKRKAVCPVVTTQALIVALVAYPLMVVSIPLGYRIFDIAGINALQVKPQRTYFTIMMLGSIIPLLRTALGNFFSGIGRTRIIMIAASITMMCNVGLNYVLIFGKMGLPALGIRGAAIGTLIAGTLGLVIEAAAYVQTAIMREFDTVRSFHFDKKLMGELLHLGYPAGLEMLLNLVAFTTLVTTFHSCGPAVAAAITITFSWDMVSFVPMIGLHIAVTSLTGRYFGAWELPTVYRSAWSGMKLSALYSCLLMIVYLFFPGPLVNLFLPETGTDLSNVRETALFMVRLISFYLFCDGALQVFGGALRGVGDTFWVMAASVTMHWTFTLLAIIMLKALHFDAKTTWVAVIIVFFFYGPIFLLRFRSGRWEKRRLKNGVKNPR
ncbi:MAG: MATE family efflux transporter [Chitinispirillaceae bacterium]|nr:MATE family efflux transporter [Chitinispirillaceae bacterium]